MTALLIGGTVLFAMIACRALYVLWAVSGEDWES